MHRLVGVRAQYGVHDGARYAALSCFEPLRRSLFDQRDGTYLFDTVRGEVAVGVEH